MSRVATGDNEDTVNTVNPLKLTFPRKLTVNDALLMTPSHCTLFFFCSLMSPDRGIRATNCSNQLLIFAKQLWVETCINLHFPSLKMFTNFVVETWLVTIQPTNYRLILIHVAECWLVNESMWHHLFPNSRADDKLVQRAQQRNRHFDISHVK